jgi:biopolymer transport protein ExbD
VRNIDAREDPINGGAEFELLAALKKHLTDQRKQINNPDLIKVQGDGKLRVRALIKVMDVCRNAGFSVVKLVPPAEQGR